MLLCLLGATGVTAEPSTVVLFDGRAKLTMPAGFTEASSKSAMRVFVDPADKVQIKCGGPVNPTGKPMAEAEFRKKSAELAELLRRDYKVLSSEMIMIQGKLWHKVVSTQAGNNKTVLRTEMFATPTSKGDMLLVQVAGFDGDASLPKISQAVVGKAIVK